jgi:predicted phage terminase large subunit-like protein
MSSAVEFTEDEIQLMLDNLDAYSPEEQAEIDKIADVLARRHTADTCRNDLIAFCKHMQPDYKVGKHHRVLADLLMQIADGEKDRVCVNIPPRHGKSHLVSTYFPAWFIGKYPDKKVLMVSHTTDLAVDFGRKVRNIIDSERFKDVFSDVMLAADSKSAGRWNTNKGGEYFACIRRYTVICTERGPIPAGQVRVGDRLLNAGGYVTVQEVFDSEHSATYNVAGLHCSAKHPVWTANRGWVEAQYLCASDVLCVASILDKIRFFLRGIRNGYVGHSDVSSLVQHKESVHQPQQREVGELRGAWNHFVRAVAYIRTFFGRHGATTDSAAYRGAYRQRWSVQSGELSLGRCNTAAEQQAQQSDFGWAYVGATCAGYGAYTRGNSVPTQSGNPAGGPKAAEEELRAYGGPENTGRVRRAAVCILTRRSKSVEPRQSKCSSEGYLARAGKTAQQLFGFLLGVRRVGSVQVTLHPEPKHFVNFLTDGDHTFFADGVLTHNCGVGSALAGRGADLLLVDDPHNEQDVINGNFGVFEKAYEWFTYGARTRLMPGGRVAIVQTRWHQDDLTGRVTRDMGQNDKADQYEVVEFPAIMEIEGDNGEIVEKPLWPEFFDIEALHRTKASMPTFQWNAQFQQNPTSEEASIVKRDWWNIWTKEDPPDCQYVIVTLDAAAETHNRADYTALTTWGVFMNEERDGPGANMYNIILLDAIKARMEFPELKDAAMRAFEEWKPDAFIVEKKSSGTALYQELRRTGLAVSEYTPHRGSGDKMARLNSVADIVRSGICWVPQTRWAEELVEEVAGFPFMANDDLVDTTTMALMRFRQGGFVRLPTDEADDTRYFKSRSGGPRYY